MPTGSHHLFHQQRGSDGFQEVVHCHLHITLLCLRHRYQIDELRRFLALTVSCASAYDLNHLRQRTAHAHRQAHLAPLPVEALLGGAQCDDDVHIVLVLHPLQVALHHIALLHIILHQVGHLQQPSVLSADVIDARVIVLILQRAYLLHNLICLGILAHASRGAGIHAGYMDDGLLRCVQHLLDVLQIRAVIEVVAQHEVLQILIAIQLLIVVIGDGIETGFIFYS